MGRFQSLLGGGEEEQDNFLDESSGAFSLSPMQRLYGFAGCLLAGLVCMLLSLVAFARPIKFAILFSFGNLLAIGSTALLIGVGQQLRMMLDPVRIYATAIYIGSVILALVCALCFHNKVLTILAIISEICALIWYSLSYIPFARRMVSELLMRTTKGVPCLSSSVWDASSYFGILRSNWWLRLHRLSFGFLVDMGTSWLHGVCKETSLASLIERLKLPLY
ncbi:hypothetical protein MRB53_002544 [Persea americana]|uniref:Uncharacterized protein n=1 Tax=Persea americana TaxID=3435 RepID=A0ACC2MVN6_PERAE|nr:hypothetical protein MRB53_002544 [Persea americana]